MLTEAMVNAGQGLGGKNNSFQVSSHTFSIGMK